MANHRAEPCRRAADRATAGRLRRAVLPAAFSSAIVASVVAAGGVAVVHPDAVASTMYELSALITEGSSTNPTGAGIEDFYGGRFAEGRDRVTVNFFTGPFGVYDALTANATDDDNLVLSSGWGAANVSLLLTYLDATGGDDPVGTNAVYVLDNSVARPNGGFGTRYPVFAVIGVNPLPTPTSPGAKVVDVGYEYDINGNTPAYVLNPFAMANSLATYFDNRLNQNEVDLPVDADGNLDLTAEECDTSCHASIDNGENTTITLDTGETVVIKQVGQTTYISFRRDGLPLLQPLRTYGGEAGNRFADAIEDPLTDLVNFGYPGNDPLADPDVYRPAAALPTPRETATFLRNLADPHNNTRPRATVRPTEDEPVVVEETEEESETTQPSSGSQPSGVRRPGSVGSIIRNTINRLTNAAPKKTTDKGADTKADEPAPDTADSAAGDAAETD
ncbi:hypothetical protein NIIDNTM18_43170 [Mycolicibacterium litorale]|uniref:PE-PPE domain-containing protein n=1 Tax=Mycolicibacterium litorale TaxID=758802 RepID=A0A6S6P9E1_9MYCO|nr:PE-PPE domain-containing protein [Mycolicibacterium litorale]BCI55039.1 hypothetical protein NIIDNTM18_43170 [Mycolicibacterium litorale]